MGIVQLNTCIKKDFAMEYYSIIKFFEKVFDKNENVKLHHIEINSGFSIYNVFTLYSVTPCITVDKNIDNKYEELLCSSLLILLDNETKNILHCVESKQSYVDIDKYLEDLFKNHFKINMDNLEYLNNFIKENISQKKNKDLASFCLSETDTNQNCNLNICFDNIEDTLSKNNCCCNHHSCTQYNNITSMFDNSYYTISPEVSNVNDPSLKIEEFPLKIYDNNIK